MNSYRKKYIAITLTVLMALTSCTARQTAGGQQPAPPQIPSAASNVNAANPSAANSGESAQNQPPSVKMEENIAPSYIDSVVAEVVSRIVEPGMSELDMAMAAFNFIIEHTVMGEPVGLDLWRIRGADDRQPDFVQNRSLSVLLFGIGMCEDYSAALAMLLRGMGLEAEYVPGLTFAADGSGLVNHAWTMVKIDGYWYHLDSQLEDNITRQGRIRYRYFLRGDETMFASHRWGQNLIDSGLLTPAQNEEIERYFIAPPAPQDFPNPPPPHDFTPRSAPNIAEISAAITEEFRIFEETYEPLQPLELDIIPPVFALEGFPARANNN